MNKEISMEINKRNTIILYNENTDMINFVVNLLQYMKFNKRKLKVFAMRNKDYTIIDEEYRNFVKNNTHAVYYDNQAYEICEGTFKHTKRKKLSKAVGEFYKYLFGKMMKK